MKQHRGMRPQDIVVLLKIAAKANRNETWFSKDLAVELGISQSEVSESLNRSRQAGLLSDNKKKLLKSALLEFLIHGLRYVFPQHPGPLTRGMATSHSAPPLNKKILSNEKFVWPWTHGTMRGQAIEPLYPGAPEACKRDGDLYELLALSDALRIGKAREKDLASKELKKQLEHAYP